MLKISEIPAFIIHVNGSSRINNINNQINKNIFKNINIFDAYTPKNLEIKNKEFYNKYYKEFSNIHPSNIGVDDPNHIIKALCLTMSHLQIIINAKKQNLENIIIFEDDFNIKDNFLEKQIINIDFDILHIGGYYTEDFVKKEINDDISQVNSVNGTFGYVINYKIYDTIINTIFEDYKNQRGLFGIDGFYANKLYSKIKCFAFIPPLVNTIACYSELQDRQVDHYDYFKSLFYKNN